MIQILVIRVKSIHLLFIQVKASVIWRNYSLVLLASSNSPAYLFSPTISSLSLSDFFFCTSPAIHYFLLVVLAIILIIFFPRRKQGYIHPTLQNNLSTKFPFYPYKQIYCLKKSVCFFGWKCNRTKILPQFYYMNL